jgi:hypothetical protein
VRLALLALVALAAALYAASHCSYLGSFEVERTAVVRVMFSFHALAPLGTGREVVVVAENSIGTAVVWGVEFRNASRLALAAVAASARWEGDLNYSITLNYYKPRERWRLGRYACYVNGSFAGYFYAVEAEPPREARAVTFTVPRDRASHYASVTFEASLPPDLAPLCYSVSAGDTGASCVKYDGANYVEGASSPGVWSAVEVNGRRPGDAVSAGAVTAAIPDPWLYTDCCSDLGAGTALLSTDLSGAEHISGARHKPFLTRVEVSVVALPVRWGAVELRPPSPVPLYVSRVLQRPGLPYWSPPESFRVSEAGNATWVGRGWRWEWTLASVAVRTGITLVPYIAVDAGGVRAVSRNATLLVPLGSASVYRAAAVWHAPALGVWVGSYPATYLRAVDDRGGVLAPHYEEAGSRRKLAYAAAKRDGGIKWAEFAAAVDGTFASAVTAWYAPPDPCAQWPRQLYVCRRAQHVFTKVNGTWTGYSKVGRPGAQWPWRVLALVDWLAPGTPARCGADSFRDFVHLVTGDPVLHYEYTYALRSWRFNPATGDWDIPDVCVHPAPQEVSLLYAVYGTQDYRNTTYARELYFQSAERGPWFYDYSFLDADDRPLWPAGWTDALPLGVASMVSDSAGPWAVALVPTTACESLACTRLSATLWGPSPPAAPDIALPGAGYSLLIVYLGDTAREITLRVRVEAGYVVESVYGRIEHRRVRDHALVEISREWRTLDAVYAGPGWHVDYRPLPQCGRLELGERAVYVTPDDWEGPVMVTLEEVERSASGEREFVVARYRFVFFVSSDVSYKIVTDTPAPERLSTPSLNITALLYVGGVPYFHGINTFGEGGRQVQFACVPAVMPAAPLPALSAAPITDQTSQLAAAGDFWGVIELLGRLRVESAFVRPRFELLDAQRGLVRVAAEGPVRGFAFYLLRDGTWVKVAEVAGRCALVNASRVLPWDPLLVLPLTRQEAAARPGETVVLWRPAPASLFKAWADAAGYPGGASSVLRDIWDVQVPHECLR